MPNRKLAGFPCPVCRASITGVIVKEEDILESKHSPVMVPAKCLNLHDVVLYVDKDFKIRDAKPIPDLELSLNKCPYCSFQGSSDQVKDHLKTHMITVNAKIDSVTVDYTGRIAFVHVVVGQSGNAKGVDVAVPLPLEMKILGKVLLESGSFSLLAD